MSKVEDQKMVTPLEIVQRNNPLITDIARVSKKWQKRWPKIDCPWPVEGTFNPEVIKTIQVLVSAYKKKGRESEKCKQKRQMELDVLQLFERESHKWAKAKKEKQQQAEEQIKVNEKQTEQLMLEVEAPFSHLTPIQKPPPYKKETELRELYPQLPVISQEGDYCITDDNDRIIETGKAETTLKMYPSTKGKVKTIHVQPKSSMWARKIDFEGDEGQTDVEGVMGGYDPVIRRILASAEKKGVKVGKKRCATGNRESEWEESDEEQGGEGPSYVEYLEKKFLAKKEEKDRQQCLKEITDEMDNCFSRLAMT